ncbi:MAG TPA: hypothetical protein VM370_01320 [Candidatus Thermoplasmatota archaeon]|nr:hypothetical protein [Candidatus Thermoplasmatota archaeon]
MDAEESPPMPRWAKVALAVGGVLLALALLVALLAPGGHGPGLHG